MSTHVHISLFDGAGQPWRFMKCKTVSWLLLDMRCLCFSQQPHSHGSLD
jgi:hypothetical protein